MIRAMKFLIPVCSLMLACSRTPADSKDQVLETGSDTAEESVGSVSQTGCVRGVLRDYDNVAYPNASIRAVELERCTVLDEDESFGDGSFCIDNLPLFSNAELQVTFSKRCEWAHSRQIQAVSKGSCSQPESCIELATWFECEGDSISCQ